MTKREPQYVLVDANDHELPHSDAAEDAVVASVLTSPGAIDAASDVLSSGAAFYSVAKGRIYNAALQTRAEGRPVDPTTVAKTLHDNGTLQAVGGFSALSLLVEGTPNSANVAAHARLVLEDADRRRVITTCRSLAAEGLARNCSTRAYLERVRSVLDSELDQCGLESDDLESESFADLIRRRKGELQEQWVGDRDWTGMSTGVEGWDVLIGGMQFGKVQVVTAHTGGGKSVAAMQAAIASAGTIIKDKAHGDYIAGWVVVNGEMLPEDLADRAVCAIGAVTDDQLQEGIPKHDPRHVEWLAHLDEVTRHLSGLPIHFVRGGRSHQQIRAICRAVQRRWDRERKPGQMRIVLKGLLIDYLALMTLPPADREDQQVSLFSKGVRKITLDLGLHTLLVSQLSREGSKRGIPLPQDLYGGSAVENDADMITFIHRPGIDGRVEELSDYAEFMALKSRKRGRGKSLLSRFDGARFRFLSATKDDEHRWAMARKRQKAEASGWRNKQQPNAD